MTVQLPLQIRPAMKTVRTSLAGRSDQLSIEEMTAALGIRPTHAYRAGDPVSPSRSEGPRRADNLWTWEVGTDQGDHLTAHLSEVASVVSRARDPEGIDLTVVTSLAAGGDVSVFRASAAVLGRLGRLVAGVALDVYPTPSPQRVDRAQTTVSYAIDATSDRDELLAHFRDELGRPIPNVLLHFSLEHHEHELDVRQLESLVRSIPTEGLSDVALRATISSTSGQGGLGLDSEALLAFGEVGVDLTVELRTPD